MGGKEYVVTRNIRLVVRMDKDGNDIEDIFDESGEADVRLKKLGYHTEEIESSKAEHILDMVRLNGHTDV